MSGTADKPSRAEGDHVDRPGDRQAPPEIGHRSQVQLRRSDSYIAGRRDVLIILREDGIALYAQAEIPRVAHRSMPVMLHRLDPGDPSRRRSVSGHGAEIRRRSDQRHGAFDAFVQQSTVIDATSEETIAHVEDLQRTQPIPIIR